MKNLLKTAAFAIGMLTATGALAASALVTTDLNIRTGPSTGYPAIGTLPNGAIVDVLGCASGYSWCRVNYQGYDGWASSRYLAQETGRYSGSNFGTTAATIGIPLIAGVVIGNALSDDDDDWDRRRDWRDRDRWDDRWDRGARREWRQERREDRRDARREWREERREDRRDARQERREDRRDARRDRRNDNDRREVRRERREDRREARQERREDRREIRRPSNGGFQDDAFRTGSRK